MDKCRVCGKPISEDDEWNDICDSCYEKGRATWDTPLP